MLSTSTCRQCNGLSAHFREFSIGPVRAFGQRLCEPCVHLERLTRPGVVAGLVHRGGLRADILTEGEIRLGDKIEAGSETSD
jgi:MOSC domain-containing protein YiiM